MVELRLSKRFSLQWAKSSEEACDRVRAQKGNFLAILMDIPLSGSALDGLQLTRVLRGKPALTDAGADGWMPKPVDFLKLMMMLSRANVMRTLETLKSPRSP